MHGGQPRRKRVKKGVDPHKTACCPCIHFVGRGEGAGFCFVLFNAALCRTVDAT